MKSRPTLLFMGFSIENMQSQDPEETTNLDNILASSVYATKNLCKKAQMESNDIIASTLEGNHGLRSQVCGRLQVRKRLIGSILINDV